MDSTTVAHHPSDGGISARHVSACPDPEPPVRFRWVNTPRSILVAAVPDAAFTLANAMEDLDNGRDGCYATTGTLAARLGLAVSHVRDARKHLRAWTMPVVTRRGRKGSKLRPDDDGYRARLPSTALYGSHKLPPRLQRVLAYVTWCNDVGVNITARAVANVVRSDRADRDGFAPVSIRTAQTLLREMTASGWIVRTGTGSGTRFYAQAAPVAVHIPGNGAAAMVHTPGNETADTIHIPGNWEVDGRPLDPLPPETGRRGPRQPGGGDPGNGAAQSRSFEYISVSTSAGASAWERAAVRRARAERDTVTR